MSAVGGVGVCTVYQTLFGSFIIFIGITCPQFILQFVNWFFIRDQIIFLHKFDHFSAAEMQRHLPRSDPGIIRFSAIHKIGCQQQFCYFRVIVHNRIVHGISAVTVNNIFCLQHRSKHYVFFKIVCEIIIAHRFTV